MMVFRLHCHSLLAKGNSLLWVLLHLDKNGYDVQSFDVQNWYVPSLMSTVLMSTVLCPKFDVQSFMQFMSQASLISKVWSPKFWSPKLWNPKFWSPHFEVQSFEVQSFDIQSFEVQRFDIQSFEVQSLTSPMSWCPEFEVQKARLYYSVLLLHFFLNLPQTTGHLKFIPCLNKLFYQSIFCTSWIVYWYVVFIIFCDCLKYSFFMEINVGKC